MEVKKDYTWENLTPREFEIVACNFAIDMFPNCEWKLTNSTRDDNHDFFTETETLNKWGEAKHSKNCDKPITRSQWDSTIVSAKLINSVNDILLITCAYIPLSYIIRSFHMTVSPITNIYCINRLILNEWYEKKQNILNNFNTNISKDTICKKIKGYSTSDLRPNEAKLYIFDKIEKNYLTTLKKLMSKCEYTINIALLVTGDNVDFKMKMGDCINVIDKPILKNLSFINERTKMSYLPKQTFDCKISRGYSVIEFHIIVNTDNENSLTTVNIEYCLGNLSKVIKIPVECQEECSRHLLIGVEKEIANDNYNKQNKIIKTSYISPHLLKRPNFKFIHIHFDERYNFNNNQLCRLFSYLLTGIDFQELDEISLRDNLYLCDYPEYIENIIIGIYSDSISSECLKYGSDKMGDLLLLFQNKTPKNVIYIIENSFHLKEDQKHILANIEQTFSRMRNNSFILFQDNLKKQLNIEYNDEIALVGIFETGIRRQYIDEKNLHQKEDLVVMDIDESLYFPGINMDIIKIKSFVLNKEIIEIENFFDKIIDIVSKQLWSSRVLDFILLLENDISDYDIFFKMVRRLRDIYYNRTDFNTAYNYSKILYRNFNKSIEQDIDDKYKEADELNHCGSIIESRKIFSKVAEKILKQDNTTYLKKGLEALTEVYNISFWLLDVENLEQSINDTINTYFSSEDDDVHEERDLYPYYNCLNRKMVVQYLLGHYSDAEKTFEINLETIKLDNYIAFAFMDSARGLYNIDICKAYERIKQAIERLEKLFIQGKEIRRYYDCLIEKSYVEFILSKQNERFAKIKDLNNAIYDAKKYGFKSITQKSYFKLAACFMVLGDIKKTEYFLKKIVNNPYFSEAPRNQFLYNELMKGYYHLLNTDMYKQRNIQTDFCDSEQSIEFKCYAAEKSNKFFIDTRMW